MILLQVGLRQWGIRLLFVDRSITLDIDSQEGFLVTLRFVTTTTNVASYAIEHTSILKV